MLLVSVEALGQALEDDERRTRDLLALGQVAGQGGGESLAFETEFVLFGFKSDGVIVAVAELLDADLTLGDIALELEQGLDGTTACEQAHPIGALPSEAVP